MDIKKIIVGESELSEIISKEILIKNIDDALEIIGNAPSEYLIFSEHNFEKDFFDLSTRKLGNILQKFTTYRIKLAIIGDFEKYTSQTLKDFIRESNSHGDYLFVASKAEVIKRWWICYQQS
mgnify:CR=1 FL=1